MSCEMCAAALARADQLEREVEANKHYQQRLMARFQRAEERTKIVERQLREALDELRLRRSATGYLPHLDVPES